MTVEARQAVTAIYYGASAPDECGSLWIDTNSSPNPIKLQTDTNPATFIIVGYSGGAPSFPDTITSLPTGVTNTVTAGYSRILFGPFTLDGTLVLDGVMGIC